MELLRDAYARFNLNDLVLWLNDIDVHLNHYKVFNRYYTNPVNTHKLLSISVVTQ
ncbi:hypothetical protein SAMN05519226_2063 [Cycloclasticus pugetii]|jgi:hypothetical protein|nr:hypothetical protein SAMN05519226_2063 [Cycloclasticus pugetii]